MVTEQKPVRRRKRGRKAAHVALRRVPEADAKKLRPVGANRENVRRLHAANPALSQVDIAAELGITRQRVKQIAIELGIEIGPVGKRAATTPPPRPITPEEIRRWRMTRQFTQEALGLMLGVTADTIGRWEGGYMAPPPMLGMALAGLEQAGA